MKKKEETKKLLHSKTITNRINSDQKPIITITRAEKEEISSEKISPPRKPSLNYLQLNSGKVDKNKSFKRNNSNKQSQNNYNKKIEDSTEKTINKSKQDNPPPNCKIKSCKNLFSLSERKSKFE